MRSLESQRGYMLLLVPVIVIAICLMGYRMASRSKTSMRVAASDLDNLRVKLAAQECLSVAANRIQVALEGSLPVPAGESACRAGAEDGERVDCSVEIGEPVGKRKRSCYGYAYQSTEVAVGSRCRDRSGKSELDETIAYGEIPLFQFAIFYDKYLPMKSMTNNEVRGLIHSNDTILIGPTNSYSAFDWVTSPKTILVDNGWNNGTADGPMNRLHFARKDGTLDGTPIRPVNNAFRAMHLSVPSWPAWKKDHRVAYGGEPNGCGEVEPLRLPVRGLDDKRVLIERRAASDGPSLRRQKFAWKANLLFDGDWRDQDGNSVTFPANPAVPPSSPPGWEVRDVLGRTRVALWNGREDLMTLLIPLDVARLQQRSPADSIIYLHDYLRDPSQGNRVTGGFLLYNGRRLVRPLTIVTNTRMVLLGDYNTDSSFIVSGRRYPFPAALASDHFTMLSNDFIPSEHTWGKELGSRITARNPAARITLNSCSMTGFAYLGDDVEEWGGHGNILRFEENLSGVPFYFSGSSVALWSPRHAQAPWSKAGGRTYYDPPERLNSYSELYGSLGRMPPGTPRVVAPGLLDWEMVRK